MTDEPRLRTADKTPPPYPLGKFPKDMIKIIAAEIVYLLYTHDRASLEGDEWERIFAAGIHAEWKPSNIGLDDVRLDNCCWGAKTVKNANPAKAKTIRLISGRNSLDFSYNASDIRNDPPQQVGDRILNIWNGRVSSVRKRFAHCRTVVLIKGPGLIPCAMFEAETLRFEVERYTWSWNKNRNLEGHDEHGVHKFTWQPHGSQFTIKENVPQDRLAFKVRAPERMSQDLALKSLKFDESWIEILP